jgi:two-component system cell cycle response regulator
MSTDPAHPPDTPVPGAPAAESPTLASQPEDEQDELDLSRFTILIVDDNAQNVELLQAYLEALPCQLAVAYDGDEAMQRLDSPEAELPDLVLLDVMMPRVSGFEVCRRIKDEPATRAIPVMMVTALNELGDIERGIESGTDDFVSKPVNKLELVTRVKSLLRMRHLKRELGRTEAQLEEVRGRIDRSATESDTAE